MNRKTVPIEGMACNGCEQNVEAALKTIEGVTRAEADHEDNRVEVVADENVTDQMIRDAVREAGYDVPTGT
ncbi:MAG: heavy-metal-associated domain-containing protein [Halobacteriaceae archaeon]